MAFAAISAAGHAGVNKVLPLKRPTAACAKRDEYYFSIRWANERPARVRHSRLRAPMILFTRTEDQQRSLIMAFSLLPKEDKYFELFLQMTEKIQEGSNILVEMLGAPDNEFDSFSKRIKSVEHECDELAHSVSTKLNTSFITPFDREDIYTLAMALDDVCDYIDASARSIVMYDIHDIDEHAKALALILQKMSVEVNGAVSFLHVAKGME